MHDHLENDRATREKRRNASLHTRACNLLLFRRTIPPLHQFFIFPTLTIFPQLFFFELRCISIAASSARGEIESDDETGYLTNRTRTTRRSRSSFCPRGSAIKKTIIVEARWRHLRHWRGLLAQQIDDKESREQRGRAVHLKEAK